VTPIVANADVNVAVQRVYAAEAVLGQNGGRAESEHRRERLGELFAHQRQAAQRHNLVGDDHSGAARFDGIAV